LPWLVPVWVVAAGAVVGYVVPRLITRSQAATARRDFRHALGAYLDVLVLLLAAHEGPESAMDLAARAGRGPAFDELRQATFRARLSGEAVWTSLDELGARIDVVELRQIASAGTLAGESGAAVRKSLTAKARALRSASLSAAEATARKQSQAMFAPLVVMGIGFILFLLYPLVTNLSVGP
jgi:Flp pilus assembly protein TadB